MPRPLASQRLGRALLVALLGSVAFVAGQTPADDKQALLDAKAAATAAANAAINSDANAPRCHSMHGGTGPCPLETWEAGAQLSLRWAARSLRFVHGTRLHERKAHSLNDAHRVAVSVAVTDPCGNGWDSFQRGWVGVICVASGGRVLSVALPNTEIRGVLLPFFGRLHEMVYLNLKDNRNVGGDVGVDLENLVELRSLMLRGTEVEGALPSLQHLGGGGTYFLPGRTPDHRPLGPFTASVMM